MKSAIARYCKFLKTEPTRGGEKQMLRRAGFATAQERGSDAVLGRAGDCFQACWEMPGADVLMGCMGSGDADWKPQINREE